jgi:hypothetical protein
VTGSDDGSWDESLLAAEESLDDEEVGVDPDEGYSPPDRPAWGITDREIGGHESLSRRLSREVPDVSALGDGDGIGDSTDTDGEPIDDQVGAERSGRLVFVDLDDSDPGEDFVARDVGIDGRAASAEEAAVHIVPDGDRA